MTHHMMCKKIAQLTKVIYHLNSKNEDQEARLADLQQRYEKEIANLEKDAEAKISKLRDGLDKATGSEAEALRTRADELASSYEQQKTEALAEMAALKKKLQASAESKIADATRQVDDLQRQTTSQLGELEKSLNESAARAHKAETELEGAVKALNAKYASMLTERMAAEDALTLEVEQTREAAERAGAAAREERAEALRAAEARRERDVESEVTRSREELEKLRAEFEHARRGLEQQLADARDGGARPGASHSACTLFRCTLFRCHLFRCMRARFSLCVSLCPLLTVACAVRVWLQVTASPRQRLPRRRRWRCSTSGPWPRCARSWSGSAGRRRRRHVGRRSVRPHSEGSLPTRARRRIARLAPSSARLPTRSPQPTH